MDKKSIIGLVLIFGIFVGYMFWVSPSKEELAERQRLYDSAMAADREAQRVADSLADYLDRHADMRQRLTTGGSCRYLTTENPDMFRQAASAFLDEDIEARHTDL